jgi:type 2A phosphatase activator TIP41
MEKVTINLPPNNKTIELNKFSHKNWDFYSHKEYMMPSTEMDLLIKNKHIEVSHLPEIFFGYNRLYLVNKSLNFSFEFSPLQMIDLSLYSKRKEFLNNNLILYEPPDVKVLHENHWKNLKMPRNDIEKIEAKSDWTFSSTYMGNFSCINKCDIKSLYKNENFEDKTFKNEINNNLQIPFEKLGPTNPIIHYEEMNFYEDELNDNGICQTKIRFRIMDDCFYGILRSYLRVDNVTIRNMDTRIFHEFGKNNIIRIFSVKDMSYDNLRKIGFAFSSEWNLSLYQSDEVDKFMGQPKIYKVDQILLS